VKTQTRLFSFVGALGVLFLSTDSVALAREDGQMTLWIKVVMADGSPAAGAIVESLSDLYDPDVVVTADAAGQARLDGVFGGGAKIWARSADGAYQATKTVPRSLVRSAVARPIELELLPAVSHEFSVLSRGRPVAGAHVAVIGVTFRARGVTTEDGKCRIRFPSDGILRGLVAWHAESGVASRRDWQGDDLTRPTQVSLVPHVPHTVRVVDTVGHPVGGLEICTYSLNHFEAARQRTDEKGEVVLPWHLQTDLLHKVLKLSGSDWKLDGGEDAAPQERTCVVRVRRRTPIEGRVVMPEGEHCENLLVTGFGFGPNRRGDIPCARVRKDGTFTMNVASSHGYVVGILDGDWASDPWSGVILGSDTDKPRSVKLDAYRATPMTIKVSRGASRGPDRDAWIEVSRRGSVAFVGGAGNPRRGTAGVKEWLRTDAEGIVRTGVGRGRIEVRLVSGDWEETKQVAAKLDEPIELSFHRNWLGNRQVMARMTRDGATYLPSPDVDVFAWTERDHRIDVIHKPEVYANGEIRLSFDHETAVILAIDRQKGHSGFARIGLQDSSVELVMEPVATYRGTLLDRNGDPIVDREIHLRVASTRLQILEPQPTDIDGQFIFNGVPVDVPLVAGIVGERHPFKVMIPIARLSLEPGEERIDERLEVRLSNAAAPKKPAVRPVAERVAHACDNVRVTGMRAVVVLQGDGLEQVSNLTRRVLNYYEIEPAIRYLSVIATPKQWKSQTAYLTERKWPSPKEGEIVMIILSGDNQTIATARIGSKDIGAGVIIGSKLLTKHMPASRNAVTVLAEASKTARNSGRRVWIVKGGPRCGPCFRLARWMADHKQTLEEDYVLVKLLGGMDEHIEEVINQLTETPHSIPWYAITEPDGTVLITSDSSTGNIGMPGSPDGRRHFRKMLTETAVRLSAKDIDRLIESLLIDP